MSVLALLRHPAVVCHGGPAEQSVLDAIAARYGAELPMELLQLCEAGQRIEIDALNAEFHRPNAILEGLQPGGWCDIPHSHGWLPVLDDRESNCMVLALRGPLARRVIWMPHDDGPSLKYRDLNSFAAGLLAAIQSNEQACLFFPDTFGDYAPAGPRTIADRADARLLLAAPHRQNEWNFAMQLLGAEDLDEWARLLETEHFIRRDARARLGQMDSEPIRQLLARDRQEFDSFATTVADAARAAGFPVGERRDIVLQINDSWYQLEGFFYRRHIPDALPRLMAFFADQADGVNPHDRPGHFFTD